MEIPNTANSAATANAASNSAAKTNIASDFDTFLRLLTAQIRNQDPLEPADSTEYTAQLATFSNVEQAVKTNDLLAQMITRLDTQQVTGASDWIGMEVRHTGPVGHTGGSTVFYTQINAVADRAELAVLDENGTEIGRYPIDPDAPSLAWPADGQGGTVPNGTYQLYVDSWAGDQKLDPTMLAHYAPVNEVLLGQSGTELIIGGGVRLPIDQLESIRRPPN